MGPRDYGIAEGSGIAEGICAGFDESELRGLILRRDRVWASLGLMLTAGWCGWAQDTRHDVEPKIPAACATIAARLDYQGDRLGTGGRGTRSKEIAQRNYNSWAGHAGEGNGASRSA